MYNSRRAYITRNAHDAIRNEQSGFLLIEVLVAISILAFGLVYISRALTSCLNALGQIANYTRAIVLAEERFFECRIRQSESGSFPGEQSFSYALRISDMGNLGLKGLDIQVNWKEGKRPGNFRIVGYLPIKE